MPLPQRWNKKRRAPPPGFELVEPVLEALEAELRDKVKESNVHKRKTESLWPVHQINWQKSRYIFDLFYRYQRISKAVYQYCVDQKLVDAALMAKWKKPGYERLCSTYVINPSNYKFGTTSLCRVPWKDRSDDQRGIPDPTTGCLGCASGGRKHGVEQPRNIFGNKYGQNLAAVQMAREQRQREKEEKRRRKEQQEQEAIERQAAEQRRLFEETQKQQQILQAGVGAPVHDADGDAPTDDEGDAATDDDDDDFGPSPAAGIWAGSQKLEQASERLAFADDDDDDDEEVGPALPPGLAGAPPPGLGPPPGLAPPPPSKKVKTDG